VCTHAPTSAAEGHRRRRHLRLQRTAFRQAQRRGTALRVRCDSRWTATIICMRFPASVPNRTGRVGRTRSAANGEGALLPKLLIFFRYGQPDAEKRSRAYSEPSLGFIGMPTGVRLGNHARLHGDEQLCATVRLDCRLQTRSSVTDVTCIEGEQLCQIGCRR
jgi:hypothetical protein